MVPRLLIYYFEEESDRFLPFDRYPRNLLRRIIRGRTMSGFRSRILNLRKGLERARIPYAFNDLRVLERCPDQCVGLVGKRHVLKTWHYPNPVVMGPAIYPHPTVIPDLLERFNVRRYLVAGRWVHEMFERYLGERVAIWPSGIDTYYWKNNRGVEKQYDFLIHEKFLWNREENCVTVLKPILEELKNRDLSYVVIHSGRYTHNKYRDLLWKSKFMVYLSEHETQGQAYQEAMACGVPVFAWDPGEWRDPLAARYEQKQVLASSTPYFSPECGMSFRDVNSFRQDLEEFMSGTYDPRSYVLRHLGLEDCARKYARFVLGKV